MKNKVDKKWIGLITALSFFVSVAITFAAERALEGAGVIVAFVLLFIFVAAGIVFDMIGVAVTSASPAPFHSMASHREPGAEQALRLLKNADKAASICNDVVGDVSGVVSGATAAALAARLVSGASLQAMLVPLILSGLVAGAPIGGKAAGKNFALRHSTRILLLVGKLLRVLSPGKGRRRAGKPRR